MRCSPRDINQSSFSKQNLNGLKFISNRRTLYPYAPDNDTHEFAANIYILHTRFINIMKNYSKEQKLRQNCVKLSSLLHFQKMKLFSSFIFIENMSLGILEVLI